MKRYSRIRDRGAAIALLDKAGWIQRPEQSDGDFEDFIRKDHTGRILLIDFAFGRFIVDLGDDLLTESTEADGNPDYDAILGSLFEMQVAVE